MDRRDFLRASGAVAGMVWIGCAADGAGALDAGAVAREGGAFPDAGTGTGTGGDAVAADLQRPDGRPPTCGQLTEPNIEGPFFAPQSPERRSLLEPSMPGVRLKISGRVLRTDCTPVAGALLDFWQADDRGVYDNSGFTLRGHQLAGADGSYELETIIPGRYLNGATYRPAHIHVKVGGQGLPLLTTQLYFEGDPFNATDPWIRESLIMSLQAGADGSKHADFDFVLAPS